ncbi:DEBR0S2_03708g1_1 [Brettanomyces bruxellensis]|uniref:DEBR0S2_03708g1_1 n=1 Tax=Dekkera bruxellensis TaxID=5007 RepID=A0A7D9H352_DEKBR|nr:DEBR0S2_03708g1_1 [Brettanomyces bruxellensis]
MKANLALNNIYSTIVRPLTFFATTASLVITLVGFFRYILNLNLLLNDKQFSPFTVSAFVVIAICAVICILVLYISIRFYILST